MEQATNSYEQERRQKLARLREMGIDPYGGRIEGVQPLADVRALFKPEMGQDGGPVVKAAGRVMLYRDMGKLTFMTLRDETGDLQVAVDKRRVDEQSWEVRGLIDLGDQVVIDGPVGVTKKGEVTVWATKVGMASKALLPPPAKHEGLQDVELRYRQRYVDLWANPDVMRVLTLRSAVVAEIRRYMTERGYLEVETPMMQSLAGGAAARPFTTHHNALDIDLYLRIAPELYLKRLLVGGYRKVFELNRNFRNEGISPRHNPEFTMLEAYEAFGSWETMADLVEGMVCHIAEKLFGGLKIEHLDKRGRAAVETYLRHRDVNSFDELCRARLDLLFPYENRRALMKASDAEKDAIDTASEGYGRGQRGFDRLQAEYKTELEGRSEAEQRTYLEPKFVVKRIDLSRPWRRVKMVDLVEERTGWKFDKRPLQVADPDLAEAMTHNEAAQSYERLKVRFPDQMSRVESLCRLIARAGGGSSVLRKSPPEQLVEVYEKLIEPTLIDPTFVTHVPSVVIPLARKWKEDEYFADVYELAINGQEISPGYSELNDPDVQAANFAQQVGDKEEQQKVDEDFLNALRYGMPPAGGLGLGIDRLVMMLTGAESIRDVILFPLMRPT